MENNGCRVVECGQGTQPPSLYPADERTRNETQERCEPCFSSGVTILAQKISRGINEQHYRSKQRWELGGGIWLNSTKSSGYFIGSERILSQSSFRLFGRSMFYPRLSVPSFLTLGGMMPVRPTGYEKRWMLAKCTLLRQQTLVAVLLNVASSFCSRCSVHTKR